MEVIKLTLSEILLGAQAGCQRQVQNLKNKSSSAYGAGIDGDWQLHVEGALGEMALAKYLGVYWDGKGIMRAPDVGNVDVRTRSQHHYDLILHPNDPDNRRFYLLTGQNGEYQVHGSILAKNGKKERFWSDPSRKNRPAFFVPKSELEAL